MNRINKKEFVDFDIHGLVGIRLINPSERDETAVHKQIGFSPTKLSREPDIIIRFVDQLLVTDLHLLGLNHSGYTNKGFFLLENGRRKGKAKIPFDQVGGICEIVCETNLGPVPLLIAILNLTLLSKGHVSLHASAFLFNGVGILTTGWAKGGKTEALFAFANNGAQYIGDEWIILSSNGEFMYGIPEPIRLWDWHLEFLPEIAKKLNLENRMTFSSIRLLEKWSQSLSKGRIKKLPPIKMLRKAMPALKRQLNITLPPSEIFGTETITAKPEKIFLLLSQSENDYQVSSIEGQQVARRMISSVQFEQLPFMEYYNAFTFAFPEKRNPFIESSKQLQNELLNRALEGKEAYQVSHPYPLSFQKLYDTMRPFCEKTLAYTHPKESVVSA